MNITPPRSPLVRQTALILVLSVALALTYNAFSAKGLPLIRVAPAKVEVPDSILFSTIEEVSKDTLPQKTKAAPAVPVVAPEHARALKNPDSMAAVVKKEAEEKAGALKVITLDQLKRLLQQHRGVLLDARSPEDYAKGHIRGARNIYGLELEKHFEEIGAIPRDTLVIIYCNNPECHLGRSLAEFMSSFSFSKLYLYDDGWDGWTGAKMPIDTTAVSAEVKP